MKYLYLLILLGTVKFSYGQDEIFFSDSPSQPGKIIEITTDKIKFNNLNVSKQYSYRNDKVLIAFNAVGNYLVFDSNKPFSNKEKEEFINPVVKDRSFDIVVDKKGIIKKVVIGDDEKAQGFTANENGKQVKFSKSDLSFIIRKDGTHVIIVTPLKNALPILISAKPRINALISDSTVSSTKAMSPASSPPTTSLPISAPAKPLTTVAPSENVKLLTVNAAAEIAAPLDTIRFRNKAIEKVDEFSGYIKRITSVNTNRDAATKSIELACDLFIDDAQVEVSNVRTGSKNKYKVRDYLGRLIYRSSQYDDVKIEYANIKYASKFKKGTDGNYYGEVDFVQTFRGFMDGKVVYGDVTTRKLIIVLKHYEKAVNGESVSGWDVFLDDIGVVETKKI